MDFCFNENKEKNLEFARFFAWMLVLIWFNLNNKIVAEFDRLILRRSGGDCGHPAEAFIDKFPHFIFNIYWSAEFSDNAQSVLIYLKSINWYNKNSIFQYGIYYSKFSGILYICFFSTMSFTFNNNNKNCSQNNWNIYLTLSSPAYLPPSPISFYLQL